MRASARFFSGCLLWFGLGISSAFADILSLPDLVVFPANIPLSTPTTITVALKITDPTYISGSAILNLLSDDNKVVKKLATFADDGKNGDLVAGDQTYTAQFTLTASIFQQYRIVGSVAYKGIIQRIQTSSSTILAASDVTANTSGVVVDGSNIIFLDAQGKPINSLAIKSFEATNVTSGASTNVITSIDTPVVSELQQTVGVFTHRVIRDINADEGDNLPTKFSYYGVDGTLLFKRTSAKDRHYFIDPNKQLLSRDGSKVLLIEVSDDETNPSVDLLDSIGQVISHFPPPPDNSYLREAYLTSNARYIGLIGKGDIEKDVSDIVIVIDAITGVIVTRSYPPENPPILVENKVGSFTIIINGNVKEQLP